MPAPANDAGIDDASQQQQQQQQQQQAERMPPPAPRQAAPQAAAAMQQDPAILATGVPVGKVILCLTGPPGAGKSSALAALPRALERLGYRALVVKECATPLFEGCGGFDPAWAGRPEQLQMQKTFLEFQLAQERAMCQLADLRPNEPTVVICDRGTLDGAGFCSAAGWEDVLQSVNKTTEDLLQQYDVIADLEGTASFEGGRLYEYGPNSSNPERFHTAEQARGLAPLISAAYSQHPRYASIAATADFQTKLDNVLTALLAAIPAPLQAAAAARAPRAPPAMQQAAEGGAPQPEGPAQPEAAAQPEPAAQPGAGTLAGPMSPAFFAQMAAAMKQAMGHAPAEDTGDRAQRAAVATANRQGLQAALRNGHGLRPRGAGETVDLSTDDQEADMEEAVDLDIDEPRVSTDEEDRRYTLLLEDMSKEWSQRHNFGVTGISAELAAGATGQAYADLGIPGISASILSQRLTHQLGFQGGPSPVRAPVGDKSLLRTAATLRCFGPKGLFKTRQPQRHFRLAQADDGSVTLADGSTNDVVNPTAACRLIWMLASFRLRWLVQICHDHPQFLPLDKLMAAWEYTEWLGILELQYDYSTVEQLDSQLMFSRLQGSWEFGMPVPAMLLDGLVGQRPLHAQQCPVCFTTGHSVTLCPLVTGNPLPQASLGAGAGGYGGGNNGHGAQNGGRRGNGANGGGNGNRNNSGGGGGGGASGGGGGGGGGGAGGSRSGPGACFAWNDGQCSRPNCRFAHQCAMTDCGGNHRQEECTKPGAAAHLAARRAGGVPARH
jgi:hypothetical protein